MDWLTFTINRNYWNNFAFDNSGRISNRYPYLQSTFNFKLADLLANPTIKIASPFGGTVSFAVNHTVFDRQNTPIDLKFTIKGAVEILFYQYGITTEEDWNNQVNKLKSNEISAPTAVFQNNYAAMIVPFDSDKDIRAVAGLTVDNFKYPGLVMKKWNDFYSLSQLWNNFNDPRLSLNYSDDIWGGAAAWGGGANLYAARNAAKEYFAGLHNFGFSSWLNYHEINHNFQAYQDPFNLQDHPWTNIPSTVNLSFLNDQLRFRNLLNWDGENTRGWAKLSNAYATNKLGHASGDWYQLYATMIYGLGPLNFLEWVRTSGIQGYSWKGLETTRYLSKHFGLNLHYAGQFFDQISDPDYRKAFPLLTTVGSASREKQILDEIYSKPAMDYVGNLYATGIYLYKPDTQTFEYTSDNQPAFEIPGFEDYTFDFEKGIATTNPNFTFDLTNVPATTKLGGKLVKNGKKVTYSPNKENLDQVDEFDIEITPGNWKGKPALYVPKYIFKIKVRSVLNRPTYTIYQQIPNVNDLNSAIEASKTADVLAKSIKVPQSFRTGTLDYFSKSGAGQVPNVLIQADMKYVAPETGEFEFWAQPDDSMKVLINGEEKGSASWTRQNPTVKLFNFNVTKDEMYNIQIFGYNKSGGGKFNYWLQKPGSDVKYYLDDSSLAPNYAADKLKAEVTVADLIKGEKFQYQPRFYDLKDLNLAEVNRITPDVPVSDKDYGTIRKGAVDISTNAWADPKYMINGEWWNAYYQTQNNAISFQYFLRNDQMQRKARTIDYFEVIRSEEHRDLSPNYVKITASLDPTMPWLEETLYEGYFDLEKQAKQKLWLSKPVSSTFLFSVIMERRDYDGKTLDPNKKGLSLAGFKAKFGVNPTELLPSNTDKIKYYGSWDLVKNDAENYHSLVNDTAAKTTTQGDYFEAEFEGNAITILGKKAEGSSSFKVYVDGKLIEANANTTKVPASLNAILYQSSFDIDKNAKHKIKIVTNEPKELVINYIVVSKV
ncbi:M60 family metallopeptidase [Mycoplasma nasistruthionis]|uniref:Peptidase M60 domain-containing protein n=1 Tax=Mycoplasma nasistruthionis TaxID=353852 RepID=A0A4Y6I7B8_9MOLU|nr:M60 family metallopeptidase [Mycoplasma nasistruthionis]QDF65137.1 hypothetical protein FIV53_02460 [Mycoplasma nasistruthionis]